MATAHIAPGFQRSLAPSAGAWIGRSKFSVPTGQAQQLASDAQRTSAWRTVLSCGLDCGSNSARRPARRSDPTVMGPGAAAIAANLRRLGSRLGRRRRRRGGHARRRSGRTVSTRAALAGDADFRASTARFGHGMLGHGDFPRTKVVRVVDEDCPDPEVRRGRRELNPQAESEAGCREHGRQNGKLKIGKPVVELGTAGSDGRAAKKRCRIGSEQTRLGDRAAQLLVLRRGAL